MRLRWCVAKLDYHNQNLRFLIAKFNKFSSRSFPLLFSFYSLDWCAMKWFISIGQTVERRSTATACKKNKLSIILQKQVASPPRYVLALFNNSLLFGPLWDPPLISVFSVTGGIMREPEKPALVWLSWPRHLLPPLLQTSSTGWEASFHWSDITLQLNQLNSAYLLCFQLLFTFSHRHNLQYWPVYVPVLCVEDYRRTACISLLKYIVEREHNSQGEGTSNNVRTVQGMTNSHMTIKLLM